MALKAKKKEADVWAEAVKKESDPDKEFVKLVAGRTRWYRIVWYVILGLLVYLIMTIGSMPPPKPPITLALRLTVLSAAMSLRSLTLYAMTQISPALVGCYLPMQTYQTNGNYR